MSDLRPLDERDDYQIHAKAAAKKLRRALRDGDVRPGAEEAAAAGAELLNEIADLKPEELREALDLEDDEEEPPQ